jgi:hypothetical protein
LQRVEEELIYNNIQSKDERRRNIQQYTMQIGEEKEKITTHNADMRGGGKYNNANRRGGGKYYNTLCR